MGPTLDSCLASTLRFTLSPLSTHVTLFLSSQTCVAWVRPSCCRGCLDLCRPQFLHL